MPRVRHDFAEFVRLWNSHSIRKQRNRPHVVPGKPYVLYHQPCPDTATDCRLELGQERLQQLQAIVDMDGIDLNAYLPSATMDVCDGIMRSLGGLPTHIPPEEATSPYLQHFDRLRQALQIHIAAGNVPAIALLPTTTGSQGYIQSLLQEHNIQLEALGGIDTGIEVEEDWP